MARNFIKRIQDNFQYDKKMYNEFVKRYGFTLPKFLFTRSYLNIFYDKNEDVVFERLSKLKDFSDVEIEKILKLMEEYPKLVKSPNYRWWLNDRNISLFIANYELNFDLINKILELDLVDLYIKFKDIFSYEKFINFVEKFDYDKSILDRLSIEDIKNNKVLNLVDLYKEKLPNEKEIIKLYNSNYIFRDFYDYYIEIDKNLLFIALENCHDLKDIDKVYNYMKILKFIPEMYDRLREIQPDLEFVLINMINNADYYQIMLEFRNERNTLADVLESFELSKKIFKNNDQFFNFIALQLENCNTLNSLKEIFKITFPESLNLIEYDVNKIDDDYVKVCYDICNLIEKSDDLNVIKENLIKFYKNFDIFKSREIVTKYLVKSEINGLFDKALDEKKIANLPKKELLIGDKKIPVYRLDGRPFESIIHVISRENQHMSRKLDLKNNPQNWGIKEEGSSILSLSMISNCHEATFGGSFSKTSLDKLVLGFDPIESEEVSSISPADSGTNTDGIGFKNILSAIMGRAQAFENTMKFNTNNYNEISVSRFLPNHEPRKPTYILVREEDIEELTSTSPQVIWANYFNIPIITLDFKKDYIDKAINPFTNMLNEILSLPEEVQFARLPELMNNYPYMFLGSSIPAKHGLELFHILELYSANRSKENAIAINNIRIPVYGKKSINIFEFIESSLHNTYYLDSADEQKEAYYACDKLTHIRNLVKYDLTSSDIKDKDNSK